MDDEGAQFDSLLGGTEELPSTISLAKFIACRTQEIQHMRSCLISQSGAKLAFQSVPKHMRRRAMSHNVKRLPRRLRQIHLNQMKKSGLPAKQKRPSRKYRRRPRNLIEEYTRRSNKKYKWLQTHIWHAKRFHMVEKWGYKLPCHPNDKAFRACYRAITKHCLIQDISYFNCIEISGDKNLIIETLKQLCRANVGLSIGARAFVNGNREGELTLFEVDGSIDKAIGTVNYEWEPFQNVNSKIWLWVHSAFYKDVLCMLIKSFNVEQCNTNKTMSMYLNRDGDVQLQELAGELNRIRLTGPLANSILQDALVILNPNSVDGCKTWVKKYLEQSINKDIVENQYTYWKSLNGITSSQVSPHTILSLIVEDPRLNLPKKRTKSVSVSDKYVENIVVSNISSSPLWDRSVRREVNESKVNNSKIIEHQSSLLIPGSEVKENSAFIPIILVQRPGNKVENIGVGSGWDLIVPSTWAKSFWCALSMRGARAGGLRESKSLLFEMGKSEFLQPDTRAGIEEERQVSNACIEKYFRKPPNKRTNYNKFNIVSPFRWNWKLLIQEWNSDPTSVDEFLVLKDSKILNSVNLLINSKTRFIPELPKNCLVPVKLECEKRGSPSKFAIICLPKCEKDLKHLVMENECADKYQKERKKLRQDHKTSLKKLKRQRKLKPGLPNLLKNHEEVLTNYKEKIRSLWLPEPTTIRWSCSREVIGFVKEGGFSLSHGKSFATGYIAANSLKSLVSLQSTNKVLFRNTNTRQYKTAKISVIVE